IGADAFWQSISSGVPGFRRVELLPYVGTPGAIGGEVSDFTDSSAKKEHLKDLKKQIKVMCREIQLGVAAALQAMRHAGLSTGDIPSDRIGVGFGANLMSSPPEVLMDSVVASSDADGHFDYSKWGLNEDNRFKGMEPLWLLRYLPNMPGCHIGIAVDARGPNNSLTLDEASGGLCVAEAANIIRRGRADVMITGTTGTRLNAVKACQAQKWDVLADGDAANRCRPLDRSRGGEVLSEAACTLILESRAHAEKRGAKIWGTLLGTGASCVAGVDGTADEQKAVEQASAMALQQAGISPADIGHVNMCASGHPERDRFEARAIHSILGQASSTIPVTALKSYLGSAGSGSALCELAGSLLGLDAGIVPRTLNFSDGDADAPLNVVSGDHLPVSNRIFLKTSVTRMGQASAVIIQA
ncbi:MAG: beta-ketoacyl-[acyl-carrier-protein] synthase family protein, partial [Planctomycetaceae bacterium]|nr:beta-ketoacyl-[acyl-carrier-protein] synthase family protein [Planctomycetaceae bacterium]